MDTADQILDIRNIINMQKTLRIILKHTFTPKQRKMVAYQRDRLPFVDSESNSDSDWQPDYEAWMPRNYRKFLLSLRGFETKTKLDRSLLLGVLERSSSGKKDLQTRQKTYKQQERMT